MPEPSSNESANASSRGGGGGGDDVDDVRNVDNPASEGSAFSSSVDADLETGASPAAAPAPPSSSSSRSNAVTTPTEGATMVDAVVDEPPRYETALNEGGGGVAPTVVSALPPPVFAADGEVVDPDTKAAIISDVPADYFGDVPVYLVDAGLQSSLLGSAGVDDGGGGGRRVDRGVGDGRGGRASRRGVAPGAVGVTPGGGGGGGPRGPGGGDGGGPDGVPTMVETAGGDDDDDDRLPRADPVPSYEDDGEDDRRGRGDADAAIPGQLVYPAFPPRRREAVCPGSPWLTYGRLLLALVAVMIASVGSLLIALWRAESSTVTVTVTNDPTVAVADAPTPGPATVSPTPRSTEWLRRSAVLAGRVRGEESGWSTATSKRGDVLAVGGRGTLRLYELLPTGADSDEKQWVETYDLSSSFSSDDAGGREIHGLAMNPSGTTLVTGDPEHFEQTGAVRVFRAVEVDESDVQVTVGASVGASGGAFWAPHGDLVPGPSRRSHYGASVAVSDNGRVIIVGAHGVDLVDVLIWASGLEWTRRHSIAGPANTGFGWSVAASRMPAKSYNREYDRRLLVGAVLPDETNGLSAAHVYDSRADMSEAVLAETLRGRHSGGDFFGSSVALSVDGRVAAVGADGGDYVVLYNLMDTDNAYLFHSVVKGDTGSRFGASVDADAEGRRLVVGAPRATGPDGGPDAGAVLLYRVDQQRGLVGTGSATGGRARDWSGTSVSVSGDGTRVVVGAFGSDGADAEKENDGPSASVETVVDGTVGDTGSDRRYGQVSVFEVELDDA